MSIHDFSLSPQSSEIMTLITEAMPMGVKVKINAGKKDQKPSRILHESIAKIYSLITALSNYSELPTGPNSEPLSSFSERVRYIGNELKRFPLSNPGDFIQPLTRKTILLANLKNALHVEAVLFSSIFKIFNFRATFLEKITALHQSNPELFADVISLIPEFHQKIHYISFAQTLLFNISDLIDRWDAIGYTQCSFEFHLVMLQLISKFQLKEKMIAIPVDSFPGESTVNILLCSSDANVRILGQLFHMSKIFMLQHVGSNFEERVLNNCLSTLDTPKITAENGFIPYYAFSEYLCKKELTPFLAILLQKRDICILEGKRLKSVLDSVDECLTLTRIIPKDWPTQITRTYDLVLRLDTLFKNFLPRLVLAQIDQITRQNNALDERIPQYVSNITKLHTTFCPSWVPPLNKDSIFCLSTDDFFRLLKSSDVSQQNLLEIAQSYAVADLVSTPKAPSPSKKSIGAKAAKKSSSTSTPKPKTPIEAKEPATASEPLKSLSAKTSAAILKEPTKKIPAPLPSACSNFPIEEITQSVLEMQYKLREISIHERISIWHKSTEEALSSRQLKRGQGLSDHEMILRHKFPRQILTYIFSPFFSVEHPADPETGRSLYESLMLIDGKQHILEAVLSSDLVLIHLYARPISCFSDYFRVAKNCVSEYPPLAPALEAAQARPLSPKSQSMQLDLTINAKGFLQIPNDEYPIEIALILN